MEIVDKRKNKNQKWQVGNIILGAGGDAQLVLCDHGCFKLANLQNGLLGSEYHSLEELKRCESNTGDLVVDAKLIIIGEDNHD